MKTLNIVDFLVKSHFSGRFSSLTCNLRYFQESCINLRGKLKKFKYLRFKIFYDYNLMYKNDCHVFLTPYYCFMDDIRVNELQNGVMKLKKVDMK